MQKINTTTIIRRISSRVDAEIASSLTVQVSLSGRNSEDVLPTEYVYSEGVPPTEMTFAGHTSKRPGLFFKNVFLIAITVILIIIVGQQHRSLIRADNTSLGSPSNIPSESWAGQPKMCQVVPEVPSWDEFYDYVEEHHPCDKTLTVGGQHGSKSDGAKTICSDPGFTIPKDHCTVLSFGINSDFSFDDAMADKLGCDVYAFDPSMRQPDQIRGQRVRFFDLGLGAKQGLGIVKVAWIDEAQSLKVDSYHGILKRLNLLNTTIDYLKMDIEEAELHFFRNVFQEHPELLRNIKQIGMEIHTGRLNTVLRDEFWQHIHHLRCLQFRPVYNQITYGKENLYHIGKRQVSAAYEVIWVNDAYIKHF